MRGFNSLHPVIMLCYFVAVIAITIFTINPVLLMISLLLSAITLIVIDYRKSIKAIIGALPFMLIISVTNPLFVHDGITVLFYLWDKPITLEALIYGIFISAMLMAMIFWFMYLAKTITSDKIIFLFGRISPAIALIISMALGLVKKAKNAFAKISEFQMTTGISISKGKPIKRIKNASHILSMLLTYLLENGVDTADSMRARGYSLPHKTTYKGYKMNCYDWIIFAIVIVLFTCSLLCIPQFYYYPVIAEISISATSIIGYISFFLLGAIPLALELIWQYTIAAALQKNFKFEGKNNVA